MTLESLTWGAELDEGSDESDMTPFPEENVVMMAYGGCPMSGSHHVSCLSPRALAHCS
jgi:hypothetical protein